MKKQLLTVRENEMVNGAVCKLVLDGGDFDGFRAGQFVEIGLDGFFLRRPFGVAEIRSNARLSQSMRGDSELVVYYKIVGQGTEAMRELSVGTKLDVLTHLGNGFSSDSAARPLLIGGGIGAAPLLQLAKEFFARGIEPQILLCARTASEFFGEDEFAKYGNVSFATDDGSKGYAGNAVQWLCEKNVEYDFYYACGPIVMLKYLTKVSTKGYVSLEARMGCGFGACMGCSVKTTSGNKRVCKEGPVFGAEEVIYD